MTSFYIWIRFHPPRPHNNHPTWPGHSLIHLSRLVRFFLSAIRQFFSTSFRVHLIVFSTSHSHALRQREREMFYLTTHSTHFIYGYMASYIWLKTILIVRKETRCRHIGYSYWLTARVLLYAPSHRQDNTCHSLCLTSRGALAGTRISSMGPPHEGSIRQPITPWANALPQSYVPFTALKQTQNLHMRTLGLYNNTTMFYH